MTTELLGPSEAAPGRSPLSCTPAPRSAWSILCQELLRAERPWGRPCCAVQKLGASGLTLLPLQTAATDGTSIKSASPIAARPLHAVDLLPSFSLLRTFMELGDRGADPAARY